MLTLLIYILLLLSLVYQLILWYFIRCKATKIDTHTKQVDKSIQISIIICSNKSHQDLKKNLSAILNQQYPDFELIVVNDGIDTMTNFLFEEISQQYPNIRQILLEKLTPGKKLALATGIAAAKNDWILLTDADCWPFSQFWIQSMVNAIGPTTRIVLGYSPYQFSSGLLNQFIRFETVLNASLYFSMARLGLAYMGVGRNILYHKSIFNYQDTRPDHTSGDDDILINHKANSSNTSICTDEDSFVFTQAKENWKEYFNQRTRHYSSSKFYTLRSKAFLFFNSFSFIIFFLSNIGLILLGLTLVPIICLSIYFIFTGFVFYKNSKILDPHQNILVFPFLIIIYLVFIILQAPLLLFQKKSW